MAIDMSQFIAVFFDEAAEHLATMESILLKLSLDEPDSEDLNAIFRAAHSIKGGAATFGFTDLAGVTHILENLLDRIRKNELDLRPDMIDVFLRSGDVLQNILSAHRDGGIADLDAAKEITSLLEKFANESGGEEAHPVNVVPDSHNGLQIIISAGERFDHSSVMHALQGYGELRSCIEGGAESDWVYQIATQASQQEIVGTLAFAVEHSRIHITQPEISASSAKLSDGDGYGFFTDDEPAKSAGLEDGDGYGFFSDEKPVAAGSQDGEGYGFFTDIAPPPAAAETVTDGAGYGFFEPRPKVLAPAGAAVEVAKVAVVKTEEAEPQAAKSKASSGAAAKPAAAADTSIRVSVEKVDQLLNLVGELVITQSMLVQTALNLDPVLHENMLSGVGQLERNTRELQESVMSIRMMPISFVFSRFPRLVRDLAGKLNKKIELKLIGESTELDKGFIEKLSDPLTHLVRNSLDHGIELPEDRIAKGKSPTGTLTLRAFHQGGNIVIEVADDGAGLNRERILAKARERDIPVSDAMTDSEVWLLIFEAGFSTAAQVTDVSGRGVGMDVVRRNIQSMGGRIEISSMYGIGSTMSIRLPLTLAILDGMSISVGEEIYLIPLAFIIESLQPRPDEVKTMAGKGRVINVRGEYLPLIALHEIFNVPPKVTQFHEGLVIILEAEGEKVAMFVDDLLGQHQVVVKNLETNYRKVPGVAGATIMGDGHVAFILDVAQLVHISQGLSRAVA
ncbi:chemotaxis protein CheW [Iodobacter fluviatilis]|uniref:Chemotaxis protein CheA n=1 Tax=Iodobacter fluviatilis TaxID=537 RepID=A0A377Q940_9NEIS|nr:chemotaxis protein CheW [Iodobacter fluviatilis]TCU87049.1 two-component system chemotaxis sensor kinase CheA [Iodobacter fluviatilis]STQ90381.1 Chemotaxis protein CheA [Iodobacter fluviatilis]